MINSWQLSALMKPLAGVELRGEARFESVNTDTRTIKPGDLFIALSGPNFNANQFVETAKNSGAVAAIVSEFQDVEIPQLLVNDTRSALGQLAGLNRQDFKGPVIAITGSSGKTTVKEMVASILRTQGSVLATKGNLNNDIGVPLTLLELAQNHDFAIVELGASAQGEIAYTVALTQPQVAIINNAGGAHLEGFGSLLGVAKAKGEIFSGLVTGGAGIINLDDPHAELWLNQLDQAGCYRFSIESKKAEVFSSDLSLQSNGCYQFTLNSKHGHQRVTLAVLGQHMVANALAAAAASMAVGIPLQCIVKGLEQFCAVSGRLVVKQTNTGCRVIDDSYNANPESVKAAIDVLQGLPGQRWLVLGNMAELGADAETLHQQVGQYAAAQGIDGLLTSGELAAKATESFQKAGGEARSFSNNEELLAWLGQRIVKDMVILVKGSRSAGMESIVNGLLAGELN